MRQLEEHRAERAQRDRDAEAGRGGNNSFTAADAERLREKKCKHKERQRELSEERLESLGETVNRQIDMEQQLRAMHSIRDRILTEIGDRARQRSRSYDYRDRYSKSDRGNDKERRSSDRSYRSSDRQLRLTSRENSRQSRPESRDRNREQGRQI